MVLGSRVAAILRTLLVLTGFALVLMVCERLHRRDLSLLLGSAAIAYGAVRVARRWSETRRIRRDGGPPPDAPDARVPVGVGGPSGPRRAADAKALPEV
jgi:hypothetical protein